MLGIFIVYTLLSTVLSITTWKDVDARIRKGIDDKAYPGAVFLAGNSNGILHSSSIGFYYYNVSEPMKMSTIFDMASCTKVFSTTSAVMQFFQRGEIDLSEKISSPRLLGNLFAHLGKDDIRVHNLLVHNSGYPPDPTPFNYYEKEFRCPETILNYHPFERFNCVAKSFSHLMTKQELMHPIGEVFKYSDLSMITMMWVIGKLARDLHYVEPGDLIEKCVNDQHPLAYFYPSSGPQPTDQCYYEAYVRKYVFGPLGMSQTGFLPSKDRWHTAAPTELDDHYLHRQIQGQVSDENTYSMGGISGHAGLFLSAPDGAKLLKAMLNPVDYFVNAETIARFTKVQNATQSSRALGWDTNMHHVLCGSLSDKTFFHSGYTGTLACVDPTRDLYIVFLTNRVNPTDKTGFAKITKVRKEVTTLVQKVIDGE